MSIDWLPRLVDTMQAFLPKDFVGQLEINVFKGSVTGVNVRLTYRPDDRRKT